MPSAYLMKYVIALERGRSVLPDALCADQPVIEDVAPNEAYAEMM